MSDTNAVTTDASLDELHGVGAVRSEQLPVETVGELANSAAQSIDNQTDELSGGEIESIVETAVEATGSLDCLVNNAGYAQFGPLEDVPTRLLEEQFAVNVLGPHRLIREALPHMREAERGTIINVSSGSGRLAAPGMGVYSSSKAALESMSDALRVEAAGFDVDVVLVEPGPVETQFDDTAQSSLSDLDRTATYEDIYRTLEDWETVGSLSSIPPEQVASVILEAGVSTDPQSRYTAGTGSEYLTLARFLPDGVRDGVFSLIRRLAG